MLSTMRAWWTLNPEVAPCMKAEMRSAHPVRKRLVDEVERVALSYDDILPSLAKMIVHAKLRNAWM